MRYCSRALPTTRTRAPECGYALDLAQAQGRLHGSAPTAAPSPRSERVRAGPSRRQVLPALGACAGLGGAGGPLRGVAAGTVARERIEDRRDDLFRRGTYGHDRAAVEQITERERF
jgi:hypothetical protein